MNVFKDRFDPDIEKELSLLESVPPRDPESAARGREYFLTEARALTPPVSNHDESRNWIGVLLTAFGGRRRSSAFAVLASIALVFGILLGGTSATVYAAQGSMPDQVLYSVKLLSEDLRLGLTSSSQAELALTFELVERRIEEIISLNDTGSDVPDSVVTRLEQHLDQSLNVVVAIEDDEVEPVMVQIQKHLRDQIQDYTQTKGQSQDGPKEGDWDRIRDMLQTNLDKVDAGIKDPEAFRHSYRNNTRYEYRYAEESEEEPVEEPVASGEGEPAEESGNTNGPGPQPVEPPDNGNGTGQQPEDPPGNTFGPGPAENADPEPGYGPGPQPEDPPADSSNGPGPQPTVTPAGYFYSPGLGTFNGSSDSGSGSNGSSGKSP